MRDYGHLVKHKPQILPFVNFYPSAKKGAQCIRYRLVRRGGVGESRPMAAGIFFSSLGKFGIISS
ncbi:MAG: hypothetical protein K0Q83_2146 [Deltaproteobacteria bacterium]|jgi:hypothetical protein|nr:hypothetical protein [Deltaproteobacteria bacterium]